MTPRIVKLQSGATLTIRASTFEISKSLYQAILEECKIVKIDTTDQVANMFKDLACIGFSSRKIEACLWECFKVCQYEGKAGNLKIDKDTFEPVDARGDYIAVCMEVAKENVLPFMKSLMHEYKRYSEMTVATQA